MLLDAALSPSFSPAIRERGAQYFRAGKVKLGLVTRDTASARVHGSDQYDVDLVLEGNTVHASCECPYSAQYGDACKHIWAMILAATPQGFARDAASRGGLELVLDESGEFDDDDDEYYRRKSAPAPRREPPRPDWKDQLATLGREIAPTGPAQTEYGRVTERQLVFVVDLAASEQARRLVVEIHIQERKVNGEWGKPRGNQMSPHLAESLVNPLDRRVYAMLIGAERGDSYGGYYSYGLPRYRLAGHMLETLLPLFAESGRVVLRADPKRPTELTGLDADLEPAWQLAVTVSDAGKDWVITGQLNRDGETVTLAEPALLVSGLVIRDNRFTRLDDGGVFAWVPTLRAAKSIAVPKSKGDELVGLLLQMPSLPKLELPEQLRHAEEAVAPRPRVVVKPGSGYNGALLVELSFEYGGVVVPALPATRGVYLAEGRRFLLRDPDAESAADLELARLGARPGWAGGGKRVVELKPSQLGKFVRELVAAGWLVEADGKLYRQPGQFTLSVSSGQDWFDVNGVADFGGQEVPFPRLLHALSRGESTVLLDDGTLGMVPDDWLQKYGLVAQMGKVEGDAVRFGRAQVGVLDALLASRPEVTFDAKFARARDQLKKFQGVAPVDPPKAFVGQLREYQREGLGWLKFLRKFGFGGCLADDMGLGKTVQVLALLAGKRNGPALVVVPRSLIFNWKREAARFAPKLKVLDHTGTTRDRAGANFADFDLILTTYGTLRRDAEMFAEQQFDTCILDESQAAKNAATETAKAVRVIQADHRLALSGTPVENHLGELWTLFDFLNPGMLGRPALAAASSAAVRNPDAETRQLLAQALRPFILRRTKDQVAKDLPAKTEQTVYCDLEPAQQKLYDELRDHYRHALLARVDSVGLNRSKIQVLEALLRLRQAACHPGLIDKTRTKETSAKLEVLLPQLHELAESGRKALVFSQFTSLLTIVKSRLDADKVKYEYLDGRTRDREERVERFQTDPNCHLFLVSLKAGGVGLNLTAAEYVFLLDPWWNPAVEAQAIDRSHRIGQTKPVFAYRLIAKNTVEEKVLALQESKRALADAILGGDGRLITELKREDLELLLS